jgi:hypothetical protein
VLWQHGSLFYDIEFLLPREKGGFMKLLSSTDFFAETMGDRPNKMEMNAYHGHPFLCACGKTHVFYLGQVEVLRELPKMRLVFECPDQPNFVTCVKVKGIFRFKGFESLFGTKVEKDLDVMGTLKNAFEKRTGIELNKKKFHGFLLKLKKAK